MAMFAGGREMTRSKVHPFAVLLDARDARSRERVTGAVPVANEAAGDSLEGKHPADCMEVVERVARVRDLVLAPGRVGVDQRPVRSALSPGVVEAALRELVDEGVGATFGDDDAEALDKAQVGQAG
jgi:hypothetical protein